MHKLEKIKKVYDLGKDAGKKVVEAASRPVRDFRAEQVAKRHALVAAAEEKVKIQNKTRFGELRLGLQAIRNLTSSVSDEQPDLAVTKGLARAINRAAQRDPNAALELTGMVAGNEQAYNDLVLNMHTDFAARTADAAETMEALKKKPLQIGSGFGRFTAALLQGDLRSLGDRATLYSGHLVIRSPVSEEAFRIVKPERFITGESYVAPGYTHGLKRLLNVVGNMVSDRHLEVLEHWMPLGQVVLARSGRDEPDATIPAWWPARKAKQLNDTIEAMLPPDPASLPLPRRESEAAHLLQSFAGENILPRQARMKATRRNEMDSIIWRKLPKRSK